MAEIQVAIYRSRADLAAFAVSPDLNGRVFPDPLLWDFWRTETINPAKAFPGSEIAVWLEAFKRDGYHVLRPAHQ